MCVATSNTSFTKEDNIVKGKEKQLTRICCICNRPTLYKKFVPRERVICATNYTGARSIDVLNIN